MMHRILAVASLVLILAACAQQVALDPDPNGDPLPVLSGVSVAPEDAVLVMGGQETVQLTAAVTGVGALDESVTWSSNDPSVATVSQSGLVTAVDDGIMLATATSVFDPAGSGSATIRVQRAVVVKDVTPAVSSNLVPIDTVLSATFNVAMDPGTIDDTTFTLLEGSLPVAGTVGYDDASRTATFTPEASLTPNTVYEAAISRDVRSASGGTLAGAEDPTRFAWSFWTAAGTGTGPEASIGGIDVTPSAETLVRGVDGPLQLTATLTDVVGDPDRAVRWSSDAESVATVDAAGVVTAVAAGAAVITARTVFEPSVSGSAAITVVPPPDAIGGVDVTPETASMEVGETQQFEATLTGIVGEPDLGVMWSSDDLDVATVDVDGLVTAVGVGEATITATSDFDARMSDTAEITVPTAAVLSVTYSQASYTYLRGFIGELAPGPTVTGAISDELIFTWARNEGGSNASWEIDVDTGAITRTDSNQNMSDQRNGNRSYTVTVQVGEDGPTKTTVVAFEELPAD